MIKGWFLCQDLKPKTIVQLVFCTSANQIHTLLQDAKCSDFILTYIKPSWRRIVHESWTTVLYHTSFFQIFHVKLENSKTLSKTASRSTDFENAPFQILPKITLIIIFWEKTSKIHGFKR